MPNSCSQNLSCLLYTIFKLKILSKWTANIAPDKINPSLAEHVIPCLLANSVDPDQLASEEANWSGSALFAIKYVNFYQNPDQVIWLAGN